MSSKKTNSVDFNYLGDKKLEKGKKELLEQSKNWKGPSNKERQEEQKETKKIAKRAVAKNTEKASWRKRAGGIVLVLFMFGAGLFSFLSTVFSFISGNGITVVDVLDTAQVKDVLFGGAPWLIYCVTNKTEHDRLPQVLEESSKDLYRSIGVKVALLKCWEPTQSGRSVAQRFKLRTTPPLAFAVANGNKPRTVNLVGLSKVEELEKKIKPILKLEIYRIDALKKWSSSCTSRRACVVIGHKNQAQRDTALNLLRPLQEKYRGLRMVTLDTAFWQMKLDEQFIATRPYGGGKGADVLCLARPDDASAEGNTTHSAKFMEAFSSSEASYFVEACEKQQGLVKLKTTPKIKARPSKPKTVKPPPISRPSPTPSPKPPVKKAGNVDRVGSRAHMEAEDEPLFEAVEEEDEEEGADEGGDGSEEGEDSEDEDDGGDEVEL